MTANIDHDGGIEGQFVCETMEDYDDVAYRAIANVLGHTLNRLPDAMAYRIFTATENRPYHIDIVRMAFNWRVRQTYPDDGGFGQSWSMYGPDRAAFVKAVTEAHRYADNPDATPRGWVQP